MIKMIRLLPLMIAGLGLVAGCRSASRGERLPDVTGAPPASDTASPAGETHSAPGDPAKEAPVAETESFAGTVAAPDFPPGLDWLNTERPLTLADLRGKVILLDFWTYGCINCIHVIPDLTRLEEKYAEELVVIGVHSAKFTNEGETENIRQIILRYELAHPVVNDRDFTIWNSYGVNAWPTFVIIDPAGKVVGYRAGEGIYDLFDYVIGGLVREFEALEKIDRTPLTLRLEQEGQTRSPLLFPGKVLADPAGERLFIADSNHNRVVVVDRAGRVLAVIGDGRSGLRDGSFETAQFFRPQGLALAGADILYVADTENHALRRVDLAARQVTTVAGTGQQGDYRVTAGRATATGLNSPWDVLVIDSEVYIAMAGRHQIWRYDPAAELVEVFAGSGREELRDGPLLQGGLNQPSGLASDGRLLYIADSEASAIRTAELAPFGQLQTIVGTGLFDFGDVDGAGNRVRLQHPLGVVYHDGLLYVADTYNSKIKQIDPAARTSMTFVGGPAAGWRDGPEPLFDEPGGLSTGGETLYIADTNNHVIRAADLATGAVRTLVLVDEQGLLTRPPQDAPFPGTIITLAPQTVGAGPGQLQLVVELPPGYKLNGLAPFSMDWTSPDGRVTFATEAASQSIIQPQFPLELPAVFREGEGNLTGELVIYYCEAEKESLCLIEQVRLTVPLTVQAAGERPSTLTISHRVPAP